MLYITSELLAIIRTLIYIIDEMYTFMCNTIPGEDLKGFEPLYSTMKDTMDALNEIDSYQKKQ